LTHVLTGPPGRGKSPGKWLVEPAYAIFDTLRQGIPGTFGSIFSWSFSPPRVYTYWWVKSSLFWGGEDGGGLGVDGSGGSNSAFSERKKAFFRGRWAYLTFFVGLDILMLL
jgi:hypothetical protein